MSTLPEIEAAIYQLSSIEQEQLFARLAENLPRRFALEQDPVLELIDRLAREVPSGPPTDIGANYKEYLYGRGSVE